MENTRRILVAVTGLTPQVVTETLYALAVRPAGAWIPHEIHLITTAMGAENARLNLLSGPGWFHRLCQDYGLPPIAFSPDHIHVVGEREGRAIEDIRTPEENSAAADFIADLVRRLTARPETELHVSIAGGRKTMGYYLGYALSLFGRPQDRLSHVLVSEPFETNPGFYYPTPYEHPIHVRRGDRLVTVDARHARVQLADIPFVRLRDVLPPTFLREPTRFSEAVAAAHCSGRPLSLLIDLSRREARAGGEPLRLSAQPFALLVWLARRRKAGQGPFHCTSYEADPRLAREYLDVVKRLHGVNSIELERAETALKRGMDSLWFSPAKNRLNNALIRALGENDASPYLVRAVGKRKDALFELTLDPNVIEFRE